MYVVGIGVEEIVEIGERKRRMNNNEKRKKETKKRERQCDQTERRWQ